MKSWTCVAIAIAIVIFGCGSETSKPASPDGSTGAPAATAAAETNRTIEPSTPKAGDPAPEFTLADQNGRSVSLSDARGEKAVLVFYRGYW